MGLYVLKNIFKNIYIKNIRIRIVRSVTPSVTKLKLKFHSSVDSRYMCVGFLNVPTYYMYLHVIFIHHYSTLLQPLVWRSDVGVSSSYWTTSWRHYVFKDWFTLISYVKLVCSNHQMYILPKQMFITVANISMSTICRTKN